MNDCLSRRFDLPMPRTSLVGRERDLTEAAALLLDPNVRLLSFTGTGGAGKTRLALAVANHLAECFPGGIQFVALASITNPELVGAAIVKALNLQPVANRTIPQMIADQMEARGPFLLILDNFEQVLQAAQLVSEILAHCTFLKTVVTTRASLQIYGEQEFPVAPLPASAAMQLFQQRAMAVRPNFAVTPENEAAIRAICDRLDGLPARDRTGGSAHEGPITESNSGTASEPVGPFDERCIGFAGKTKDASQDD